MKGIAILYILAGLLLILLVFAAMIGSVIGGEPLSPSLSLGLLAWGPIAVVPGIVQRYLVGPIERSRSEGKGRYSRETESLWNWVYLMRIIPLVYFVLFTALASLRVI